MSHWKFSQNVTQLIDLLSRIYTLILQNWERESVHSPYPKINSFIKNLHLWNLKFNIEKKRQDNSYSHKLHPCWKTDIIRCCKEPGFNKDTEPRYQSSRTNNICKIYQPKLNLSNAILNQKERKIEHKQTKIEIYSEF